MPMLWLAAAHMTGKMRIVANGRCAVRRDVFHRQRALFEEFFHVGIVALGHHFHQRFVSRSALPRRILGRDVAFFALTVAIRACRCRLFMRIRSTMPLNSRSVPIGQVDRDRGASEVFLDAVERALENRRGRDPAC